MQLFTLLTALALSLSCSNKLQVEAKSYNTITTTVKCVNTLQVKKGLTIVQIPGDGVFKGGFERA